MKTKMTFPQIIPTHRTVIYLDGETETETETTTETETEGGDKTFTQAQVDKIVEDRLGRESKTKQTLVTQLEALKTNQALTVEEKEGLASRIDELETSMMSEAEKTARGQKKQAETHSLALKESGAETALWQKRYESSTIERALTDAAVSADASDPAQIRMMFEGTAYLSADKDPDTGKETGGFTPMLKVSLPVEGAKNGEKETVDVPISEGINRIKEAGLHKNLFKHGSTGGTGSKPGKQGGGAATDPKIMPQPEDFNTPKEFREAYDTYRESYEIDGTPIKKEA